MALAPGDGLLLVAALLVSVAAVLVWFLGYPVIAEAVAPGLAPQIRFERFILVPVPVDRGTVIFMSGALVAALVPLHFYLRKIVDLREALDRQVAEFLDAYVGLVASAGNSYDALRIAAEMSAPPLSVILERAARLYKLTGSLPEAFNAAARQLPRRARLFARAAVLVARTGGDPARVVGNVAAYARESRRLSLAVRSRLGEYKLVVALSSLTYAVAAGVVQGLVEAMSGLRLPSGPIVAVDPGVLLGLHYYSILIVAAAAAAVLSRVIEGTLLLAPKYLAILLAVSTTVFLAASFLVNPAF
ncbi:MAG: type II secretion system F family protein [Crenarchaeota archaeon]|nr:type II secretion system F family protein [Thermoproteota archaeon]